MVGLKMNPIHLRSATLQINSTEYLDVSDVTIEFSTPTAKHASGADRILGYLVVCEFELLPNSQEDIKKYLHLVNSVCNIAVLTKLDSWIFDNSYLTISSKNDFNLKGSKQHFKFQKAYADKDAVDIIFSSQGELWNIEADVSDNWNLSLSWDTNLDGDFLIEVLK
jgi:hypothetical protein